MLLFNQLHPFRMWVIMALHYFLPFCTIYKFARLTSVLFCHPFSQIRYSQFTLDYVTFSIFWGCIDSSGCRWAWLSTYVFFIISEFSCMVWKIVEGFSRRIPVFETQRFLLLKCLPSKSGENSHICYLTGSWDKKERIHAFHQGSYAKVNQETSQKFDIDSLILFSVLIPVRLPTPLEHCIKFFRWFSPQVILSEHKHPCS